MLVHAVGTAGKRLRTWDSWTLYDPTSDRTSDLGILKQQIGEGYYEALCCVASLILTGLEYVEDQQPAPKIDVGVTPEHAKDCDAVVRAIYTARTFAHILDPYMYCGYAKKMYEAGRVTRSDAWSPEWVYELLCSYSPKPPLVSG